MKSTAIYCVTFLFAFCFSALTYADCPATNQVKYGCSVVAGKKHCNWGAPWYEGFPEKEANAGEKALSFHYVFWGAKSNSPQPKDVGTSVCFYQSSHGHEIELVQNRWGGITYPEDAAWVKGDWQGHNGMICGNGLAQDRCHFAYPA